MEKKVKRQLKRRTRMLLLAAASLLAATLIWSLAVEPALLTVTGIEHADARLPEAMDGVRIVYFSDLHAGPFYKPADVERVAARIEALKPDMLLFGGDMLQHEADATMLDRNRVAAAFAAIRPRLGKYAVYGNHDISSTLTKAIAQTILMKGGFTILENDAAEVAPGFYIAGTAPWPTEGENNPKNHADVSRVAWTTDNGAYSLLMAHEPPQIRKNAAYAFALQLSGHTHGGQVALPFLSSLRLPDGTEVYRAGFYRQNDTAMYVSTGIGTSIVRMRMFVPPQIVVLTLRRDKLEE